MQRFNTAFAKARKDGNSAIGSSNHWICNDLEVTMKFINWLARFVARGQAAHPLNPPFIRRLARAEPEDFGKTILWLNITGVICVILYIWGKEQQEKAENEFSATIRDIGANLPKPDFSGLREQVRQMNDRDNPIAKQFEENFKPGGRFEGYLTQPTRPVTPLHPDS